MHKDQHGVMISSIHTTLLTSGCTKYDQRGKKDMQGRAYDKRCKTYPTNGWAVETVGDGSGRQRVLGGELPLPVGGAAALVAALAL